MSGFEDGGRTPQARKEPPEGKEPCGHLDLHPVRLFWISDLQNCKMMNLCLRSLIPGLPVRREGFEEPQGGL